MITHYVLFKYEDNFMDDEKLSEMKSVFDSVCDNVEGAVSYRIDKNAVSRQSNMDVMVTMTLKDEKSLAEYVNYPSHVEISKRYAPHITKICSFDVKE